MSKKIVPYILAVVLLIIGLALGFFTGKGLQKPVETSEAPAATLAAEYNSLYASQTATIRGLITNRSGSDLMVTNLNNQVEGKIRASERIIITRSAVKQATPSAGLDTIELNKEALIGLEMIGGTYQAVSIQYLIPAPSLPPLFKPSSQP